MLLADCSYGYVYGKNSLPPPWAAQDSVNSDYTNKNYPAAPPWQVNSDMFPIPGPVAGPVATLGNIPLHGGVINTAFADGHVVSISSMSAFAQAAHPPDALW